MGKASALPRKGEGLRHMGDPLRQLLGLVERRTDIDAYLTETRGPAWQTGRDGE